jgi:hypothetical protein
MRRSLRELLAVLRAAPEEGDAARCERCLEELYDPERRSPVAHAEHDVAEVEAERRRWARGSAVASADQRDEPDLL